MPLIQVRRQFLQMIRELFMAGLIQVFLDGLPLFRLTIKDYGAAYQRTLPCVLCRR